MKTIYILEQRIMNGTVTLDIMTSGFATKELAERCEKALAEQNKKLDMIKVVSSVKEMTIYENESECACLNDTPL